MAARLGLLCIAALLAVATGCSGNEAKANDTNTADVYTAVLRQLMPPPAAGEDEIVVYVAPFEDQKAIGLETQVGVIEALADEATVRFVDELSEAVEDGEDGEPAKGAGVILLGPVVTTGDVIEVDAQRYATAADQVRYRFRVSAVGEGEWRAQQVEAVDVPPTTTP